MKTPSPITHHPSPVLHAKGKLLLSGEYFILDGAIGIGLPVNKGQTLEVTPLGASDDIHWQSQTHTGEIWFEGTFSRADWSILHSTDEAIAGPLQKLLRLASADLQIQTGLKMVAQLEFPRIWGFGSSSTLISLLAQWGNKDPFQLSAQSFGGSGYDIACATASQAIFYQRKRSNPLITPVEIDLPTDQLYFIFLGQKQNSREGINRYRQMIGLEKSILVDTITRISQQIVKASDLSTLNPLLKQHEEVVSQSLQLPRAQSLYFKDYWGVVKSLGAWGGDFVMATSDRSAEETRGYFVEKGFETVFEWRELVL